MPAGWRRFTILEHDHPRLHWDLLLDAGESLWTWRLLSPPSRQQWIDAEPLPDHRRVYLDYEGPLSGDRGHVLQTHTGLYRRRSTSNEDQRVAPERLLADGDVLDLSQTDLAVEAICRCDAQDNWQWWFA